MQFTIIAAEVHVPDEWSEEQLGEFDRSPEMAELRAGLQALVTRWQSRYGHMAQIKEPSDVI